MDSAAELSSRQVLSCSETQIYMLGPSYCDHHHGGQGGDVQLCFSGEENQGLSIFWGCWAGNQGRQGGNGNFHWISRGSAVLAVTLGLRASSGRCLFSRGSRSSPSREGLLCEGWESHGLFLCRLKQGGFPDVFSFQLYEGCKASLQVLDCTTHCTRRGP